jgi:hypothetical protein
MPSSVADSFIIYAMKITFNDLMMEAARISEMSVDIQLRTRQISPLLSIRVDIINK